MKKPIPLNTKVKVVKATDDSFDQSFLNMEGTVVDYNTNTMTGNTKADPLHTVRFDLNCVPVDHPQYKEDAFVIENFWHEELEPLTDNVHISNTPETKEFLKGIEQAFNQIMYTTPKLK